jgi:hypothetical protein
VKIQFAPKAETVHEDDDFKTVAQDAEELFFDQRVPNSLLRNNSASDDSVCSGSAGCPERCRDASDWEASIGTPSGDPPSLIPRLGYDSDDSSVDSIEDALQDNGLGSTQDALDDIAREARQRKATKLDDAEIPAYLWEEHLMMTDGLTPWNAESTDMPKLRRRMNLMRRRMLVWWKSKVTWSFLCWIGARLDIIANADAWVDSIIQDRVSPAPQSQDIITHQQNSYEWSPTGKDEYRTWWRQRYSLAGRDIEEGADAIGRAADSSWWTWDDGSRPFHWRWPAWYMSTIRGGLEVYFISDKPSYRKRHSQTDAREVGQGPEATVHLRCFCQVIDCIFCSC